MKYCRLLLPPLALFLLPCLLLWQTVFGNAALLPAEMLRDVAPWRTSNPADLVPWNPLLWDGIAEFYPWRQFYADTLQTGYLPLWNPHQFCGTPFAANSQSAIFYPFNLLFCLMPLWRAFGVSTLLHLFLTGLFAYYYLRNGLKLSSGASLLGAISWQLCLRQIVWLALPTFLCVSTWLPLALLLIDFAVQRPTALRAAPLALCLGLMVLAGHLQIAFYCFCLLSAYALFRILPIFRTDWPKLLKCASITLALTLGIGAPQLLPVLELARFSHRAGTAVNWDAYNSYVHLALPPIHLITLFLPGFFGNPTQGTYWGSGLNGGPSAYQENACYGGVLTLLLALVAIFTTWKNPLTRFLSLAAAIALLLALGTPLNTLFFFGIPGFAQTGSPGRVLVVWSFCLPVLAAIGADQLREKYSHAMVKAIVSYLVLALLTVLSTIVWLSINATDSIHAMILSSDGADLTRLLAAILLAAGVTYGLFLRGSLKPSFLSGILACLCAIDLLATGYGFNRTAAPREVYPVTPLISYLQAHKDEGRVMPVNSHWSLYDPPPAILPPNTATVYGLFDTQGYDSLQTNQYFHLAAAMDRGSPAPPENGNMVFTNGVGSALARAASARFIVTKGPLTIPGLLLRFSENGNYVYEDMGTMPHIRTSATNEKFTTVADLPTRLVFEGEGNQNFDSITVADQWYLGWKAKFDGMPITISQGPLFFRMLQLTPQMQSASKTKVSVVMWYDPMSIRLGIYALCLAISVMAALGSAAIFRILAHSTSESAISKFA